MDHLAEHGITDIEIECVVREDMNPPTDKRAFHSYPERKGWRVEHDYKLDIQDNASSPEYFDVLLQSWLFFGLIFTVVQKDYRPILTFDDLHDGNQLDTKKLNGALKEWYTWELDHPDTIGIRMIQVDYILDKARQVVRRNCGYNHKTDQVEYSENPGDSRHLTDEIALELMTIGETIAAVKMKIMEAKINANIPGWHGDDDGGWGPPRYVFSQMTADGWCSRSVHLLKGQLRSNATLLLSAYQAYYRSTRMTFNHDKCDADECKFQSVDENGVYTRRHTPTCENEGHECEMLGPNISEVLDILKKNPTEGGSHKLADVPFLKFFGDEESPELRVKTLTDEDENFATISHVWSDGWGNETENKLLICQLKFIRRQLRKASGDKDILFWMDTLVIPVGAQTTELQDLKKKAIGQIFKVFEKSTYTIILDNGLCGMSLGENGKPAQAAMKILASGWMRRLWTLQEAFLSRKLYIVFKEKGPRYFNLKDLDVLDKTIRSKGAVDLLASPLLSMVRDQLLHNIMGHEREDRNFILSHKKEKGQTIPPKAASTLVVNAWRAARWRVSIYQ